MIIIIAAADRLERYRGFVGTYIIPPLCKIALPILGNVGGMIIY